MKTKLSDYTLEESEDILFYKKTTYVWDGYKFVYCKNGVVKQLITFFNPPSLSMAVTNPRRTLRAVLKSSDGKLDTYCFYFDNFVRRGLSFYKKGILK